MTTRPVASTARPARTSRPTLISRLCVCGMVAVLLRQLPSGQEVAELPVGAALRGRPVADETEVPRGQIGDAVADLAGQGDVVGDHHLRDGPMAVDLSN